MGYQMSAENVAPDWMTASADQTVDNRLDLLQHGRVSRRLRRLHHVPGGLFAGSRARPSQGGPEFRRHGDPRALRQRLLLPHGRHVRVLHGPGDALPGHRSTRLPGPPRSRLELRHAGLEPDESHAFNPGAATTVTPITYDPASPQAQWVSWQLSDSIWSAVQQATMNMTPTPLVAAWAAPDETQSGWAYFAKIEVGASTAPYAGYALSYPVPVAAYSINMGGTGTNGPAFLLQHHPQRP